MQSRNLDYGRQMSDTNEGEMAKRALLTMAKDLYNLYVSLNDGDDLPEWCHYKLATSRKDLSDITDYLTSKVMKRCLDSNMTADVLRLEIKKSMSDSLLEEGFFSDTFKSIKNKLTNKKTLSKEEIKKELFANNFRYQQNNLIKFIKNTDNIANQLYNPSSSIYIDNNIYSVDKGTAISGTKIVKLAYTHLNILKKMKQRIEDSFSIRENYLKNKATNNIAANFIGIASSLAEKNMIYNWIENAEDYYFELDGIIKEEENLVRLLAKNLHTYNKKNKSSEDFRREIVEIKKEIKFNLRQVLVEMLENSINNVSNHVNKLQAASSALEIVYSNRDKYDRDKMRSNSRPFSSPQDKFETDIASKYISTTGPKNHERYRKV